MACPQSRLPFPFPDFFRGETDFSLEFDMKYHNLHDFGTSTPFKKELSNHLQKLKLLTSFDINLTSSPGGVNVSS